MPDHPVPKIYTLIARTGECYIAKKYIKAVIKLRFFKWEDYIFKYLYISSVSRIDIKSWPDNFV